MQKVDIPSFFTNSKEVWVSENFKNIILINYTRTKSGEQKKSIGSSDLQDIRPETNIQEFVFEDIDAFLEQLALLIQNQINGEDGLLLNDSSANYFFVRGRDTKHYSILVRWEPAQRLWRCGAYLQEELKFPGIRIFGPVD